MVLWQDLQQVCVHATHCLQLCHVLSNVQCSACQRSPDWLHVQRLTAARCAETIKDVCAGSVIGIRNGSIGSAATTGMMFAAASMAVDACNGRERVNIFAQDPTPVNPYANRIVLPKY